MPHSGIEIPEYIVKTMTQEALMRKDTDWFVDKLYDFAPLLGANIIKPTFSRYVIDLNRGVDRINLYPGANSTELCPTTTFNLSSIYLEGKEPSVEEIENRIEKYWQPYHNCIQKRLAEIKAKHGFAILLDAHSILSEVPRFFEGQLPDFNFGTVDDTSSASAVINSIQGINYSPYSMVCNQRFKGGYITRAYGQPDENIHTIQLELSQHTYMNESDLTFNQSSFERVHPYIEQVVKQLLTLDIQQLSAS